MVAASALFATASFASASTSPDGFDGKGQVGIQSDEFRNAAANSYKIKHCADSVDAKALKAEIEADILDASAKTGIEAGKLLVLVDARAKNIDASFTKAGADVSWVCDTTSVDEFRSFSTFTWSQIPADAASK
ncbi:hypothetical protein F9K94_21720 [Brucella tritici]|uniref:Uncharacterized protein n=1 Tax=Brucella tritici TaxID=94626 RepID=A0A7V7VR79_9HYPH|nr:hypothetical protein [Brucella tritici]KAB2655173.1 hypothetical protein F9K94_21720 [Brucella tritici]